MNSLEILKGLSPHMIQWDEILTKPQDAAKPDDQFTWLEELYSSSDPEAALNLVFEHMIPLAEAESYEEIERQLDALNLERLTIDLCFAFVFVLMYKRDHIRNFKNYYHRVRKEIQSRRR